MKPEYFEQMLTNNTVLVETNRKLVNGNVKLIENNSKVIDFASERITRNEDLLNIAFQIYQGLSDKESKSIIEIGWHRGLKKIFG